MQKTVAFVKHPQYFARLVVCELLFCLRFFTWNVKIDCNGNFRKSLRIRTKKVSKISITIVLNVPSKRLQIKRRAAHAENRGGE